MDKGLINYTNNFNFTHLQWRTVEEFVKFWHILYIHGRLEKKELIDRWV